MCTIMKINSFNNYQKKKKKSRPLFLYTWYGYGYIHNAYMVLKRSRVKENKMHIENVCRSHNFCPSRTFNSLTGALKCVIGSLHASPLITIIPHSEEWMIVEYLLMFIFSF